MDSLGTKHPVKAGISSDQIEHASIHEHVLFSPQEERKLVRKVDLTLLPMIWIMYLLSYMDRTK